MGPALDRAEWHAEATGALSLRQLVEVAQENDLRHPLGERAHGSNDAVVPVSGHHQRLLAIAGIPMRTH